MPSGRLLSLQKMWGDPLVGNSSISDPTVATMYTKLLRSQYWLLVGCCHQEHKAPTKREKKWEITNGNITKMTQFNALWTHTNWSSKNLEQASGEAREGQVQEDISVSSWLNAVGVVRRVYLERATGEAREGLVVCDPCLYRPWHLHTSPDNYVWRL